MKLLIFSDLHLEWSGFSVPECDYDAVILAGDIGVCDQGVEWAKQFITDVPVIYICGNHEYYQYEINEVQESIRESVKDSNVHYCENETVWIGQVRFLCATLWTDFRLLGNPELAKIDAGGWMNDYRLIANGTRNLLPADTEQFHWQSRRYLESEFSRDVAPGTKTVVVTHHAPSKQSLTYERVDDTLAGAYASSMDELIIQSGADLWVHGHTHESVDYQVGSTRVVSNPRGYSKKRDGNGNHNFNHRCIIEV